MPSISTKLFIPSRIKVGFQKRSDTYTQKLAYVIYYDAKGQLRKETSWEHWRHKDIDPVEFDNEPRSGFVLNKDVRRYGWSYYSSGRSMIRIYDDRGIEFEITPANLLFILMNTNCHKRELEGEFVYAWDGKELVLLPTCCEEYQQSTEHTKLQASKVSAKDLKPGATYRDKKGEDWIYLGRFKSRKQSGRYYKECYTFENQHIFVSPDGTDFQARKPDSFAQLVSADCVDNFAELLTTFQQSKYYQLPVKFSLLPIHGPEHPDTYRWDGSHYYAQVSDTEVIEFEKRPKYYYSSDNYIPTFRRKFTITKELKSTQLNISTTPNPKDILYSVDMIKAQVQIELQNGESIDYVKY